MSQHGATASDVHTIASATVLDNIAALYGRALSRELLPIETATGYANTRSTSGTEPGVDTSAGASAGAGAGVGAGAGQGSGIAPRDILGGPTVGGVDMGVRYKVKGYVSNANYSMKKSVFMLFINDRLVDCGSLKRVCVLRAEDSCLLVTPDPAFLLCSQAVESVFSDYLPKRTHPFVYLSIHMPGPHVDVNVHPTKREVHFLHEDAVTSGVQTAVETALEGANSSRNYYTQVLLAPTVNPSRTSAGLTIRAAHRNAQAPTSSLGAKSVDYTEEGSAASEAPGTDPGQSASLGQNEAGNTGQQVLLSMQPMSSCTSHTCWVCRLRELPARWLRIGLCARMLRRATWMLSSCTQGPHVRILIPGGQAMLRLPAPVGVLPLATKPTPHRQLTGRRPRSFPAGSEVEPLRRPRLARLLAWMSTTRERR